MNKGFIEPGPDIKKLFELTPAEKARLQSLLDWQKASESCRYILGGSVQCRGCFVNNNPNNPVCWHCGKPLPTL